MTVRNASDRSVAVDRFETSCGCVVVEPRSAKIGANGSIALRVRFDPRDEPDFRGRLAVNLTGKGADDRVVLAMTVEVEVVPEAISHARAPGTDVVGAPPFDPDSCAGALDRTLGKERR